ncbi:hypothetical protein LCGC14_1471800 [marine sediment metagenome]|uniref:Uncharacterized protein n=1 Tax=marine sediment metagenome TaxID=412755 RepID=A0A0F9JC54_9ZZZZ
MEQSAKNALLLVVTFSINGLGVIFVLEEIRNILKKIADQAEAKKKGDPSEVRQVRDPES